MDIGKYIPKLDPAPRFGRQFYWNKKTIYNIRSRIYHREKKGERIKVDMMLHEEIETYWRGTDMMSRVHQTLTRDDIWTDETAEQLNEQGYRRCSGLYDSIVWWGVPVYLRIRGEYNQQELVRSKKDDAGNLVYSQDTAATLNDFMQNKSTMNFLKGMGKIQMSSMDMQKMGMIAILGAGVFFGMYMMGVF